MGKVLRVFVVVIFLLSLAALYLANSLYGKRELLKGRIINFQRGVEQLARAVEAAPPAPPSVTPNYPEKDISSLEEAVNGNPRRAQFWNSYRPELESLDQPMVNLSGEDKRRELMSFYRMDPVTGKKVLDPVTGAPVTDGPGTMKGILDELISKAGDQYTRLTATRQQLRVLREELVATIREYNEMKDMVRTKMVEVDQAKAALAEAERKQAEAERKARESEARARENEMRISDLEQEKLVLSEEADSMRFKNDEMVEVVKGLRAQIEDLKRIELGPSTGGGQIAGDGSVPTGMARVDISLGSKGTVASVDQRHQFVVMTLDEAFVQELVAASSDGRLPLIDLLIEREDGTFVGKVRIAQLKADAGFAIGDILSDWQQGEIQIGNRVVFQ